MCSYYGDSTVCELVIKNAGPCSVVLYTKVYIQCTTCSLIYLKFMFSFDEILECFVF